jgi:hypothetical protein
VLLGLIDLLLVGVAAGVVGFVAGAVTMAVARRGGGGIAPPALPARQDDVLRASLKDVRRGGLLHIKAGGEGFEDVDLEVERFDRYEAGRDEWGLAEGTFQNHPYGLEWQEVRGDLRAWAHKRLRALTAEQVGLGAQALAALAVGKAHTHAGVTYTVELAGKALRHEGGTGFGKEHDAWRLTSADGKRVLRLERWDDKPAAASLGEAIDPADVEIYKVRA